MHKRMIISLGVGILVLAIASYAYSRRTVTHVFQMKWNVTETLGGKGVDLVFIDNPYWYIRADSAELAEKLQLKNEPVVTVTLFTRGDKIGNITDVGGVPGPFVLGIGNGCGRPNMGSCNSDNSFDAGERPWR